MCRSLDLMRFICQIQLMKPLSENNILKYIMLQARLGFFSPVTSKISSRRYQLKYCWCTCNISWYFSLCGQDCYCRLNIYQLTWYMLHLLLCPKTWKIESQKHSWGFVPMIRQVFQKFKASRTLETEPVCVSWKYYISLHKIVHDLWVLLRINSSLYWFCSCWNSFCSLSLEND